MPDGGILIRPKGWRKIIFFVGIYSTFLFELTASTCRTVVNDIPQFKDKSIFEAYQVGFSTSFGGQLLCSSGFSFCHALVLQNRKSEVQALFHKEDRLSKRKNDALIGPTRSFLSGLRSRPLEAVMISSEFCGSAVSTKSFLT